MSWTLFFDGDCGFCTRSVQALKSVDKHGRIALSPLQGERAAALNLTGHAASKGGTMVLLRESDGHLFRRSDAAIELARALGGGWRLFTVARFIPRFLRDRVYQWIADHRHLFAGRKGTCGLPDR